MTYWRDTVAIVTGGSAGLGRCLVEALAARGAVVVPAARSSPQLEQVGRHVEAAGGRARCIAADITQDADVQALFSETIEAFGGLDVLINCAGRSDRGLACETPRERFRELWELNFLATVRCSQAAAPLLRQSRGHLVNIGSLASKTASRYLGAYPASKFAVAAFTQQLRYELGPDGVHVMLVCPGPLRRDDAGPRYQDQAAGLPAEAQGPGGGAKLKTLDPAAFSERILQACQARRLELVAPSSARWLFAISQLWPSWGDWLLKKRTS